MRTVAELSTGVTADMLHVDWGDDDYAVPTRAMCARAEATSAATTEAALTVDGLAAAVPAVAEMRRQ